MYLMWLDDTKKPTPDKIAGGIAAYRDRFGVDPSIVLVNELDLCNVEGVRVQSEAYVRRNVFWIGPIVVEGA